MAETGTHPKVRQRIRDVLPALSAEELAGLEEQVRTEGCRDPLVAWKEEDILLDGHNRLAICRRLGKPYKVVRLSFPDEDAAVRWVKRNALNRRNLAPAYQALLRGEIYEAEKKPEGRPEKLSQSDTVSRGATRERLAESLGVSPPTLARDGAFARAVAAIAGVAPGVRDAVRDGNLSRADASLLAAAVATNPREVAAAVERAAKGEPALPRPPRPENGVKPAEAAPAETPARKWLRLLTERVEGLDGVVRNVRHHGLKHLTRKWGEEERGDFVGALKCARKVIDELLKEVE